MYIGECYEREFVWNHLLIVLREILYYMQSNDKQTFMKDFQQRYKHKFDEVLISSMFAHIEVLIGGCNTYRELLTKQKETGKSPVEIIYDKICPSSHRYLTSSYLIGNADICKKWVSCHDYGCE